MLFVMGRAQAAESMDSLQALNKPVPGGVAVIALGTHHTPPDRDLHGQASAGCPRIATPGQWIAVVGVTPVPDSAFTIHPLTNSVRTKRDSF